MANKLEPGKMYRLRWAGDFFICHDGDFNYAAMLPSHRVRLLYLGKDTPRFLKTAGIREEFHSFLTHEGSVAFKANIEPSSHPTFNNNLEVFSKA
jgi:hypothetical protein